MENFRKLYINFTNENKMMRTLRTLPNWDVKEENIMGFDYIAFEGYEDKILFSKLNIDKYLINSINILNQDPIVQEMSGYLPLKNDLTYTLYKEIKTQYDFLFAEENDNDISIYDDGLRVSISLSDNDFINL